MTREKSELVMDKNPTPTARFDPFPNVTILCFGRPLDWSTSMVITQEDVARHDLAHRIAGIALAHETKVILAPCAQKSNGVICQRSDLATKISVQAMIGMVPINVSVERGFDADGTIIGPREAFYVSTGDCLVGVMTDKGSRRTVAFHASRESLLPRQWLDPDQHDGGSRKMSVIENALNQLKPEGEVAAFFCNGINSTHFGHSWDDPVHGVRNQSLCEFVSARYGTRCIEQTTLDDIREGKLSLHELARNQCEDSGIKPGNIGSDSIDTFGDTGPDGKPIWWSYRRGDGRQRNGVLVIRKF